MKPKALWTAAFLASAIAAPAGAQHGSHGKPASHGVAPTGPPPPALMLDGKPFPPVLPRAAKLPEPLRTFFVAGGKENGDGSEQHPWTDLPTSLRALAPGDRLRVRAGAYTGSLRIDEDCQDGTPANPIQVVFEGKASVTPGPGAAALTIRRPHWIVVGLFLQLGESAEAGVLVGGPGGRHLTLDGVRIAGGTGPGVLLGEGASDVTVSNARITRKSVASPDSTACGIEIQPGTTAIRLFRNHLSGCPGAAIRVNAPDSDTPAARSLIFEGNTIREGAAGIDVAAARRLRIENNTLTGLPGRIGAGIVLERVQDVMVRRNVLSGFAVGIQVGRVNPEDGASASAEDATIGRNYMETTQPGSAGIDIEAARRVRVANNAVVGFATGLLLFGGKPLTQVVTIANNLFLDVGEIAFVLSDPRAAALFDYNIFSARADAPQVQVGGETLALEAFLKQGAMPHSRMARVTFAHGDLARVTGSDVVDRGTAVPGLESKGSAPDIGVAER